MKRIFLYLVAFLTLAACKDDDDSQDQLFIGEEARVFILNEGNFQFGNAGISIYDPKENQLQNDLFQNSNSGRPIGDVVQSMKILGDKGFIVVNNSSKIEVVNMADFKSVGNIAPLNSPRYLLPISEQEALVSDLFEGKISRVNLQTLEITAAIETGGWTEEMEQAEEKVFVCHTDSSQVLVIDLKQMKIVDRIATFTEPQHIRKDVNGNLWVACTGGLAQDQAALILIDPNNHQILKTLVPNRPADRIHELEINSAKDELYYFSEGGLYKVSIQADQLPSSPWISEEDGLFYGLGVDPFTDEIYIADAIDFQQRGVVFRYSPQANLIDHFRVGIIPGDFVFYE